MASPYSDLPETQPPATTAVPPGTSGPAASDANLDPLTNEPGAHPVGVGVGAASAGAVGALIGAVAGPVGVLVGSVVGAFAGAAVGKETAETVNPTETSALTKGSQDTVPFVDPAAETVAEESLPYDEPVPPPEPMAEPAPPPAVTSGTGSHLRKLVLAEHPASAPIEVHARDAYPEDHVREAAYFRYLERLRTGQAGSELDDWTDAEREVLRG